MHLSNINLQDKSWSIIGVTLNAPRLSENVRKLLIITINIIKTSQVIQK